MYNKYFEVVLNEDKKCCHGSYIFIFYTFTDERIR